MPDVKDVPKPSLRESRAAVTRERIIGAARGLFRSHGYATTTLIEIAAEAGVAVQTVYAVYGSKAGILRALRGTVRDQPEAEALYVEALAKRRGTRKLELFARSIRSRWGYGADIVLIDRDAATADRAIRDEVESILAMRRAGIGRLVASFDRLPGTGGDAGRATAIIDALTLPEVYVELVDVQGWTPDAYEAWLARVLKQQLIG